MNTSEISEALADHYSAAFEKNGAIPQGVNWGVEPKNHLIRLERMLGVTQRGTRAEEVNSLLDVGCGFGSLLNHALERRYLLDLYRAITY